MEDINILVQLAQKHANRSGKPLYVAKVNDSFRIFPVMPYEAAFFLTINPDPVVRVPIRELQEDIEKLLADATYSRKFSSTDEIYYLGCEESLKQVLRLFGEDQFSR